jgi:AraC-like DNA-binding protein
LGGPEGPSVTVFRPIIFGITELGLEWKSLLESCGIDPDLVADPEARVPAEVFDRFWLRAAELTADPCFGLHVGEGVRPLAVNINGYLLLSSPTAREGLERVVAYQRLVFGVDWIELVDRSPYAMIRFGPTDDDALHLAIQIEFRAAIVLRLLDWITAIDFRASEVRFRHRPAGPRSEYERILKCPVKFQSQHSELVVSQSSLDQPSIHANAEIARIHQEHAKRHLAELEDQSIARKVKTVLMSRLDCGSCELPDVARSLHMSRRTLQRRLDEEGTSYKATLDSLRRELCLQYLQRPDTPLAEVAYIAGFADASALSRAVRRWTGQTPLEYRRSHSV